MAGRGTQNVGPIRRKDTASLLDLSATAQPISKSSTLSFLSRRESLQRTGQGLFDLIQVQRCAA